MKRILAVIVMLTLCLGMLPVGAQSAALTVAVDKKEYSLSITGAVTPAQAQTVTLFIYLPLAETPQEATGSLTSFCYYAAETRTAADGTFSFHKTLSQSDPSGRYQVRVGTKGVSPAAADSFFHVSENEYDALHTWITAVPKPTAAELNQKLQAGEEVYKAMGVQMAAYQNLSGEAHRLSVCAAVLAQSSFADGRAVIAAINRAIALETLNQTKTEESFAATVSEFGEILQVTLPQDDAAAQQAEMWRLLFGRKPYKDVTTVQNALSECRAVAAVNIAVWGEIPTVLETYQDVFGTLLTGDYAKLSQSQQTAVCYAVKDGGAYLTAEAVTQAFYKAVKSQKSGSGSGSSTGGGSGGGSGSGTKRGSGVAQLPSLTPIDPLPQNGETTFVDLSQFDWAKADIAKLWEMGVIAGTDAAHFEPMRNVLKEEFVKMIVMLTDDADTSAASSFRDIEADHWCSPYVGAAAVMGLVQGDVEGAFGRGTEISRQDAAVILCRFLEKKGAVLTKGDDDVFTDAASVADYAEEAVKKLHRTGILNGFEDGTFRPDKSCSRAEAAVMISRAHAMAE